MPPKFQGKTLFFLKKKGAGVLTDHLQIPFTFLAVLASKI